ncbi:hypothetical protein [Akkermansia sp. NBRC 115031]|uniref:hypothetical protein n=1 Tax=unclassified Akkermansia TaxID=2608915 RepID=UPI0033425740
MKKASRGAVLSVSIRLTGLFLPLAQWFFLTGKFVGKGGCPLRFQEGLFPLRSAFLPAVRLKQEGQKPEGRTGKFSGEFVFVHDCPNLLFTQEPFFLFRFERGPVNHDG